MRRVKWCLIALLWCAVSTSLRAAELPKFVAICEDSGEWPPFIYSERVDGLVNGPAAGLSVELIGKIFEPAGITYRIDMLPWKRCMKEVESGSYLMLLNATMNDDRRAIYLVSTGHSWITPHYFYSKSRFPAGLDIKTTDDLRKYRVGGILGYNYEYYGLKESEVISNGIYNSLDMTSRLRAGMFDIFLENYEIVAGFRQLGTDLIQVGNLGYQRAPGTEPTSIHMLLKKSKEGEAVKELVDRRLAEMIKNGDLAALQMKYVGTGMVLGR